MIKLKKRKFLFILVLVFAISGLISVVTGTAVALFQVDIKGKTINEINSSKIDLIYTEQEQPSILGILTDSTGIYNDNFFQFSLDTSSSGDSSFEYYIYLTEEEGNTIPKDKIKLFLTDENDVPVSDYYTTKNDDDGVFCYDYFNGKTYTNQDAGFSNCQNMNFETNCYLMDTIYFGSIDTKNNLICRKYEKSQSIESEVTSIDNCRYGEVYKGKALSYNELESDTSNDLTNIIYKGTYKNIKGDSYYDDVKSGSKKTFRLRVWANSYDNSVITNENEKFKYKVNVFAKQIELDYSGEDYEQ